MDRQTYLNDKNFPLQLTFNYDSVRGMKIFKIALWINSHESDSYTIKINACTESYLLKVTLVHEIKF